jgi:hypothetical protein
MNEYDGGRWFHALVYPIAVDSVPDDGSAFDIDTVLSHALHRPLSFRDFMEYQTCKKHKDDTHER